MQIKHKYLNFLINLSAKVNTGYCNNFRCGLLWKLSNYLSYKFLFKLVGKIVPGSKSKDFFTKNEVNIWKLVIELNEEINLQNRWLTVFKLFGTDIKNLAYLEDRVLVNLAGNQRYGTQIKESNGIYELYPIVGISNGTRLNVFDLHALNQRRRSVELEPIENYLQKLYKTKKVFVQI